MLEVIGFIMSQEVGEQPTLFLALSADGAVSRMGSGLLNSDERDVCMGQLPTPVLNAVLDGLDHEWLFTSGSWSVLEPGEEPSTLSLQFFHADGSRTAFTIEYGSDAALPKDLRALLPRAIELTNPWYQEFRARTET